MVVVAGVNCRFRGGLVAPGGAAVGVEHGPEVEVVLGVEALGEGERELGAYGQFVGSRRGTCPRTVAGRHGVIDGVAVGEVCRVGEGGCGYVLRHGLLRRHTRYGVRHAAHAAAVGTHGYGLPRELRLAVGFRQDYALRRRGDVEAGEDVDAHGLAAVGGVGTSHDNLLRALGEAVLRRGDGAARRYVAHGIFGAVNLDDDGEGGGKRRAGTRLRRDRQRDGAQRGVGAVEVHRYVGCLPRGGKGDVGRQHEETGEPHVLAVILDERLALRHRVDGVKRRLEDAPGRLGAHQRVEEARRRVVGHRAVVLGVHLRTVYVAEGFLLGVGPS